MSVKEILYRKTLDLPIVAYTIISEVIEVANTSKTTIDDIAGACIAVRLRMLNRVVTNIYDDALRPLGLKVSQMNILVAAAKIGTARPSEVCDHLHLDVSTLSRNVDRMKARGWLEVVPDEDGRSQPFRLTAQGRKLLDRAIPSWDEAQERVKELLGSDIVNQLNHAMRRISERPALADFYLPRYLHIQLQDCHEARRSSHCPARSQPPDGSP